MKPNPARHPRIEFSFGCAREFPWERGTPVPEEPIKVGFQELLELARAAEILASDVRTFCRPVEVPWHMLSRPRAPGRLTGNHPSGEIARLGLVKEEGWRIVSSVDAALLTRHRLEFLEKAIICTRGLKTFPQGILGPERRHAIKIIRLMQRVAGRAVCSHHLMLGPPRTSLLYELNNVIPKTLVSRMESLSRTLARLLPRESESSLEVPEAVASAAGKTGRIDLRRKSDVLRQDAQQGTMPTVADLTDTQKALVVALARATSEGNGRTLGNLCGDIMANSPSTVHRALVALRVRGWTIPNRRNGAGYFLEGPSLKSARELLKNDAQRTPKQR